MCGIIGFAGRKNAKELLLAGLYALEYRGYDSAGVAISEEGGIRVYKKSGRVSELDSLLKASNGANGTCGIGHTRWATHGMPTVENAHPHTAKNLVIVHNGIIDNYLEIKSRLTERGIAFASETDTECAAHLVSEKYGECHDPIRAIVEAASEMTGSFALGIIFRDRPDEIFATRKDSPLICALSEDGAYLASDVPAILPYSRSIYRIGEREIIALSKDAIAFYAPDGTPIHKDAISIEWSVDAAKKDGYDCFMNKEIHEEPDAIRRAVIHRLDENGLPCFQADGVDASVFADIDTLSIIGCGSATHAGLVGKFIIESLCHIPVTVDLASEYRYAPPVTAGKTLAVLISQSGETADTLAALRLAKSRGLSTLGIINVVGSAIARESDHVLYTNAGPEIAVATTKGYTTQVAMLAVLGIGIALAKGTISEEKAKELCHALSEEVPEGVRSIIAREEEIGELAKAVCRSEDLFYIGRGIDFPASVEASLKLKEISYIHSEAYAAGELKHGTLSLITEETPVISLATDPLYYDKMAGNMKEVRARGGKVILLCPADFERPEEYADKVFRLPPVPPMLSPFFTVVFGQTLAYRTTLLRGYDVDHPRNLAKSVTVE